MRSCAFGVSRSYDCKMRKIGGSNIAKMLRFYSLHDWSGEVEVIQLRISISCLLWRPGIRTRYLLPRFSSFRVVRFRVRVIELPVVPSFRVVRFRVRVIDLCVCECFSASNMCHFLSYHISDTIENFGVHLPAIKGEWLKYTPERNFPLCLHAGQLFLLTQSQLFLRTALVVSAGTLIIISCLHWPCSSDQLFPLSLFFLSAFSNDPILPVSCFNWPYSSNQLFALTLFLRSAVSSPYSSYQLFPMTLFFQSAVSIDPILPISCFPMTPFFQSSCFHWP